MKRILIIVAVLLVCLNMWAIDLRFNPPVIEVNQLSTFSFDPVAPESQPILTNLTITNDNVPQKIKLQVVVKWNNTPILDEGEAIFISINELGSREVLLLSNRDLITEQSSQYFVEESVNIDFMDIIESISTLEEAVLSGYFPDGNLRLEVSVKPEEENNWTETALFTIRVRNAGGIFLASPGAQIGQKAPEVNDLPVSFIWNAVNTGFNEQHIVIREFPPNNPPSLSNINNSGTVVLQKEGVDSGFSDYIPFNDGYYYAWQVYIPLYDETHYHAPAPDRAGKIAKQQESPWFVFRYVMNADGSSSSEDIQAMLNVLQNSELLNLQGLGYSPTGEIIYDGRLYRGQDALDILSSLIGKQLTIKVID
ncbi:MAG: hypothetical protein LHW59_04650 [Candidatus Cloacimonetes bacterium]|nr:hypothetical protein [Candidatus Cloacimonadota bacterium]